MNINTNNVEIVKDKVIINGVSLAAWALADAAPTAIH